ncbi:hypothetical protein [Actinotignum urinale]|uniref:Uncharacterized protein n=1 Tax=Actinotignum urinale TaxID=190146 RepID=A0ABU5G881_9ACTO|nr:hypothetical protein [Actinotignum urinale]MDY5133426.1 hypothetical protein [Actinotignum urinale]
MISELHLELVELLQAGVDLEDLEATYRQACQRGAHLTAECIERYPEDYLKIVAAWFEDAAVAA